MSAGDQQAMIRSMVDGLAQKLEADPRNLDGWLRLIRARVVLKETDVAQGAWTRPARSLSKIKVPNRSLRHWHRNWD